MFKVMYRIWRTGYGVKIKMCSRLAVHTFSEIK